MVYAFMVKMTGQAVLEQIVIIITMLALEVTHNLGDTIQHRSDKLPSIPSESSAG